MEARSRGERADGALFAQTLESLKQEGANILLVGPGAKAAHERVCCRLLGELSDQPRYRLIVTASETTYRGHSCTAAETGPETNVFKIDPPADGQSAGSTDSAVLAAENRCETETKETHLTHTPEVSLSVLGSAVFDAVTEIEAGSDGLEPAELRVCVDSLVPFLSDYQTETVFRFLHMTTASVKQVSGMGHFHLPLDADHDAVNLLEPLFDATVEVRIRDGGYEQRWYLRDSNGPSEWIEL
ncbi:hypothetical protein OB919_17970 [Halobacteria archaeon AArc-curdl1]|uniref:Uncharacterized protein n=1 Tax=Natronosalvus hydrolyticus TaxID=2979988 RepID=A0AAP2ZBR3_9EURY|nr:hypothetical protein [Halobacteria archaeon AArc-curdl1]